MDKQIADITSKVQSINIKETLDKKFCDLVFSLLGKSVKVKLPDNQEGEGIFYTINPKNGGVMIKNYKEQTHCYPGEENQSKKQNQNESNNTKCLLKQDFIYLFAEDVEDPPYIQDFKSIQKDTKNLKTDGELTKLDKNREREFQAVDFIFDNGESIEDGDDLNQKAKSSSFKNLDQFQINQQKFGVGTEFKDEFYTTKLDISKFDKKQIEQAEKLEQQVNKEGSKHKHVLIDRGRDDLLADSDEEKNFSAVHESGRFKSDQNNKKGSTKEISSQNKLESKENQGNSDEISFGKGRPQFSKKTTNKESSATSKESEQTKKEEDQVNEGARDSKKEEALPVIQTKTSQESNQEQKKQSANTKLNDTNKQNSQSIIFVEKVEPPVKEQSKTEVQNSTSTIPSQNQSQPLTTITNNNNQNGENSKAAITENQAAQKTQELSEKDKQAQQPQIINDQNSQSQQQQQNQATNTTTTTTSTTTTAAAAVTPQNQEEKPKVRKQLKMKNNTEFKVETPQQEGKPTSQNQNQYYEQYPNQQQNEQINYMQYPQPMIPHMYYPNMQPYVMPNQIYPQQMFPPPNMNMLYQNQAQAFQQPQQQQQYQQGYNKHQFKKPQGQQ
ncbi:hypothetical protein ABPG74_000520 [Tetrahymena malaccensis]